MSDTLTLEDIPTTLNAKDAATDLCLTEHTSLEEKAQV